MERDGYAVKTIFTKLLILRQWHDIPRTSICNRGMIYGAKGLHGYKGWGWWRLRREDVGVGCSKLRYWGGV